MTRRELAVLAAWVGLLVVIAVAEPAAGGSSGGFLVRNEVRNTLVKNAPILVAAVGMTLVILARQIDISVGAQMAVCAVAAGLLARSGCPVWLAAVGAVLLGPYSGRSRAGWSRG